MISATHRSHAAGAENVPHASVPDGERISRNTVRAAQIAAAGAAQATIRRSVSTVTDGSDPHGQRRPRARNEAHGRRLDHTMTPPTT